MEHTGQPVFVCAVCTMQMRQAGEETALGT